MKTFLPHSWVRWFDEHRRFLALLLPFVLLRGVALLYLRPGGFVIDQAPDNYFYWEMARLSNGGQWPFWNYWAEYPPLMPWLLSLAYQISLFIPPWHFPIFWPNLIFRLMLLPFEAANLALIYLLALQLYSRERALWLATLWALLSAPLLTFLSWYEPLALCFLLLALYGVLTDNALLAGAAMGVGFMVKVFPALLMPVGVWAARTHRDRLKLIGSAAVTAGVVIVPPLLAAPQYVWAWLAGLSGRSSWSTVWALWEGYAGFGVVAPLANRNDPAAAAFTVHPASLPWWPITLVFGLVFLLVITRRIDWRNRQSILWMSLFSFGLFLLYSKGYSPQWAVYPSALALLAFPTLQGLGYALLLDVCLLAEFPVANVLFFKQPWVSATVTLVRTGVILLITGEALARLWPTGRLARVARQWALPLGVSLVIGAVVIAARPAWLAYSETRLQADPLSPWIEARAEASAAPILLSQPELMERLRPYLPGETLHYLPNGQGQMWTASSTWLPTQLAGADQAWLLYNAETNAAHQDLNAQLRQWLDERGCPVVQTWYEQVWVGHYVLSPSPPVQSFTAVFVNGAQLRAATVPATFRAGEAVCLRFTWQVSQTISADHAIFVHWLSPNGELAAQSDIWPAPPMSAWQPGQTYTTSHGLLLPPDLPPGQYTVTIGLYTPDGARIPLLTGEAELVLGRLDLLP